MQARDGYPPGVPCFVDTTQPDPDAAAEFYGRLFGWEFEDRMPSGSSERYYGARLHGLEVAGIGSQPGGAPQEAVWNTYVWVDSADEAAAKAKQAGGSVLVEPVDFHDAARLAVLADPSGAVFSVWQANTHRGAQLVNAAGSWNWSDLNTRDPEGAKAFYGAVFGWQAAEVDFGMGVSYMWRVEGYADALEKLDPGIRERHAEGGAPAGFSDAIGWMQPMSPDQFADEVPPHWSVTFSVEDADAVAAAAGELGGKVLVPPFDAGPTRVAILEDPQGAVFTVSRYQPE